MAEISKRPWTLGLDVGGTHIKARSLEADGEPFGEPVRVPTPRPATPGALLDSLCYVAGHAEYHRVSVGFPGVVVEGVTHTAPNLDEGWAGFALADELSGRLSVPVRVINDADMAGYGVIDGAGVEMILTLGTGMGSAVFVDGVLVPNLELGHHPMVGDETYEQRIADAVLKEIGEELWNARVLEVVALTRRIWTWRRLYLGGGNARLLDRAALPDDVKRVGNNAGVQGAVRLWS